jgi:hypothetical protein
MTTRPLKLRAQDESIVPESVSVGQQKSFIIENATILNRETKLAILSIVMMEIGPSVIMEAGGSREVDIDLDAVAASNEEVLAHIYNIVQTRRSALSRPAGTTRTTPVGAR